MVSCWINPILCYRPPPPIQMQRQSSPTAFLNPVLSIVPSPQQRFLSFFRSQQHFASQWRYQLAWDEVIKNEYSLRNDLKRLLILK